MTTATSASLSLIRRNTSRPSIPSILMSNSRMSKRFSRHFFKALSPLAAVCTAWPSRCSQAASDSRMITSSSTIRIRALFTATSCAGELPGQRTDGYFDLERGAFTDLGVYANGAAMFLDDAVDHRKPQADPLAFFLGGEKRLEELGHVLLRDADPVVFDLDQHLVAILREPGYDPQHAAVPGFHGLDGIRDQV